MNRLIVPPTSFYNPSSTVGTLGAPAGVVGASMGNPAPLQPASLHQAAMMIHQHHQQQQQNQQQQNGNSQQLSQPGSSAASSASAIATTEKQQTVAAGIKVPGSVGEPSATTHHFPRQIVSSLTKLVLIETCLTWNFVGTCLMEKDHCSDGDYIFHLVQKRAEKESLVYFIDNFFILSFVQLSLEIFNKITIQS